MKLADIVGNSLVLQYGVETLDEKLTTDEDLVKDIQQHLRTIGYRVIVDGIFGRITREALNDFKEEYHLGQLDQLGATTADKLLDVARNDEFIFTYPPVRYDNRQFLCKIPDDWAQAALNEEDYDNVSEQFDIEEAVLRAVVEVESAGSGFLLREPVPARPKILFEAHIFGRYSNYRFNASHPTLSQRSWNRNLYVGGSAEWDRFYAAAKLDLEAALYSISIGLGQVMGFNHGVVDDDDVTFKRQGHNYLIFGYNDVREMICEAHIDEHYQLVQMMNFIKNNGLLDDLRRKDWAGFARGYNGSGYRANSYDRKLASAYAKWLKRV